MTFGVQGVGGARGIEVGGSGAEGPGSPGSPGGAWSAVRRLRSSHARTLALVQKVRVVTQTSCHKPPTLHSELKLIHAHACQAWVTTRTFCTRASVRACDEQSLLAALQAPRPPSSQACAQGGTRSLLEIVVAQSACPCACRLCSAYGVSLLCLCARTAPGSC